MSEDETLGCVRCDAVVPVRAMLWLAHVLICDECFEKTADTPYRAVRIIS